MSAKQFFKSTAFKCVVTLLCVLLISGIFLTLMNGLLAVSEEERFQRDLAKIYGSYVETKEIDISNETTTFDNASIVVAYTVSDGNYLIKATGKQGYGGDVTCWVVVNMSKDGKAIEGVGNVVVGSDPNDAKGESFLSNITSSHLSEFSKITYTDGFVYELGFKNDSETQGDNYIATGASKTMRAISNAVNGAINYVKVHALGATIDVSTPYDDFNYTAYINKKETTHTFEDGIVTFNIVTSQNGLVPNPYKITVKVNAEGAITEYTINKTGAFAYDKDYPAIEYGNKFSEYLVGKTAADIKAIVGDSEDLAYNNSNIGSYEEDGEKIFTGATQSNFANLYAALFATSNYENALKSAFGYTSYINMDETGYTFEDGIVTFNIVTSQNGLVPNPYKITVKVNAEGAITEYTINKTGAFAYDKDYPAIEYGNKFSEYLVGKTAADIKAIVGDSEDLAYNNSNIGSYEEDGEKIFTGATQSNFANLYAALFATSNYGLATILAGGNN